MDARHVFAAGLALIGLSCFRGAQVDASWMWEQFVPIQIMQAIGQPMAVVSMLFLATSVVQPMEGPYVSGFVNTLRALSTLLGGALVNPSPPTCHSSPAHHIAGPTQRPGVRPDRRNRRRR